MTGLNEIIQRKELAVSFPNDFGVTIELDANAILDVSEVAVITMSELLEISVFHADREENHS